MFGLLIFVSRKASFEFVIMFNNTCESSLSKPYINISWESVLFILILLLLKLSSIVLSHSARLTDIHKHL